jgi:hypothetical protein
VTALRWCTNRGAVVAQVDRDHIDARLGHAELLEGAGRATQSVALQWIERGRRAAVIGARAHPHLDHHACRTLVHDQIHLHPT